MPAPLAESAMSDAKHTPGPWTTVCNARGTHGVYGPDNEYVAETLAPHLAATRTEAEIAANAALIASAPDLLAENARLRTALTSALAILVQLQDAGHPVHVEIAEARAALAPAKQEG
jgi:hypothetical protein